MIAFTVSLGNWQLRRADEKAALQAIRDEAAAAGPVDFTGRSGDPGDLVGSLLRVTGQFDDDRTVFLDNRTHNGIAGFYVVRSEEHTSELQSRENLVCRLLLEKNKRQSGD